MSEKHSAARTRYWASLSPEARTERMRAIAVTRQKKLSPRERRIFALKMVAGRRLKRL